MKRFLICIGCISILFLIGCNHRKNKREMFVYNGYGLQTSYFIQYDKNSGDLKGEIDRVISDIERSMMMEDPNSLVSRINRNDSNSLVDEHFANVFLFSKLIYQETGGAFNPSIGPLFRYWQLDKEKFKNPWVADSAQVDSLKGLTHFDDVILQGNQLSKKRRQVQLDFNAVVKGYAVDKLAEMFDKFSVQNYRIEIGGESRVKGEDDEGKVWKTAIDKPTDKTGTRDVMGIVKLDNLAFSSSGSYRTWYDKKGSRYAYTIDPGTGYPVKHTLISIYVFAPTCAEADAYATAFMVMGVEKTKAFVAGKKDLQVYMISADYKGQWVTYMSDGLKNRLEIKKEDL